MSKKLIFAFFLVAIFFGVLYKTKKKPANVNHDASKAGKELDNHAVLLPTHKEKALLLLALKQDPKAKNVLLKDLEEKDKRVEAAKLLAYYSDPKVEEELVKVLRESDPGDRWEILKAWPSRLTPGRLRLLKTAVQSMALTPRDNLYYDIALLALEQDKEKQKSIVREFLNKYRKNPDQEIKSQFFKFIISRQARNLQVRDEVMGILNSMKISDQAVFIESLRALKVICPKNRHEILRKVITDPKLPAKIREAGIFELVAHPAPEAFTILGEVEGGDLSRGIPVQTIAFVKKRLGEIKDRGECFR